jgi:hypothetical protein
MVKTNLKTNKTAHVVLFSSDLELGYEHMIDYYRLRFQLEFNFRDAKQYWGLEDFMSVKGNRSATENRDHAAACDFWSLSGSRDGAGSPRNAASCAAVR